MQKVESQFMFRKLLGSVSVKFQFCYVNQISRELMLKTFALQSPTLNVSN